MLRNIFSTIFSGWMAGAWYRAGILGLALTAGAPFASAQAAAQPSERVVQRITKEIRHELLMLPNLGVFDHLAYKVDGNKVTLLGSVSQPTLKRDAESAVKGIEGVEHIDNQIEVLPPSPMDDRLRRQLFQAIYGFASLERYALSVNKPIQIIVKSGHVTLEGVVDSEADKNVAGIRANSVPGIFSVENNLTISK